VNTLLVSDRAGVASASAVTTLRVVVRRGAPLDDLNLTGREIPASGTIAVQSPARLLDGQQATAAMTAAMKTGMRAFPVFTYLANSIRSRTHDVPYSLVAGIDPEISGLSGCSGCLQTSADEAPPIVVNEWTARELGVKVDDPITLEYFV